MSEINNTANTIEKPKPVRLEGPSSKKADKMLEQIMEHYNLINVNKKTGQPYAVIDGPYRFQGPDIDGDGKIVDDWVTFSETVGYKLFSEVILGIHARKIKNKKLEEKCYKNFERTWNWTYENLMRKNIKEVYNCNSQKWIPGNKMDSLLAWRYITSLGGRKGGVIHDHQTRAEDNRWIDGWDVAPDGDQFTAVALYMASKLWPDRAQKYPYYENAKNIVHDLRIKCIKNIGGKNYLLSGDTAKYVNGINPSYSFEAAYENIFPELDPEGAQVWKSIIQTSYDVAVKGADSTFHTSLKEEITGVKNLPPNWVSVKEDHTFTDMPWSNDIDWLFGWDAMRTLAMKTWHLEVNPNNESAIRYFTDKTGTTKDFGPLAFLANTYKAEGKLQLGYGLDGSTNHTDLLIEGANTENAFSLGIHMAYFSEAGEKEIMLDMFNKLETLYVGDRNGNGKIEAFEASFWTDKAEYFKLLKQGQGKRKINGKIIDIKEFIHSPIIEASGKEFGHEGTVIIEKNQYFRSDWAWFGLATANGWVADAFAYISDKK